MSDPTPDEQDMAGVGAVSSSPSADAVAPQHLDAVPRTPELSEDPAVTAPSQAPAPQIMAGGVPASSSEPDERCAAALDLARSAATQVAGTAVGEHLEVEAEQDAGHGHVVTHWFATTDPAYAGWRWAVSVVRAADADEVTVDEVVLLPAGSALLAPAWVPWSERVQPGDLGPGDLLPPPPDDPRLVPAYADVEADLLPFDLHRELGLGRARVLSLEGRADAAERWYEGEAGPASPIAKAAPGQCRDCGFFAPLAGALGRVFGACANGMAPDDGRVVALTHGCGAHSETVVEQPESSYAGMAVEHEELDELELVDTRADGVASAVAEASARPVAAAPVASDAPPSASSAGAEPDSGRPVADLAVDAAPTAVAADGASSAADAVDALPSVSDAADTAPSAIDPASEPDTAPAVPAVAVEVEATSDDADLGGTSSDGDAHTATTLEATAPNA